MGAKEQQRIGSLGSCSHFATYCVTVSSLVSLGPSFPNCSRRVLDTQSSGLLQLSHSLFGDGVLQGGEGLREVVVWLPARWGSTLKGGAGSLAQHYSEPEF